MNYFFCDECVRTTERIVLHAFISTTGPGKKLNRRSSCCNYYYLERAGLKRAGLERAGFSLFDPYC